MNPLPSLRALISLTVAVLAAAGMLSACASGLVPDAVALAFEPGGATPDTAAMRAVATFDAALQAPAIFAAHPSVTPVPSSTMSPTPSPTPTPTATPSPTPQPTRTSTTRPTATATRRPTATPSPTPNHVATAEALQRQIDTAVAATLTAQPTLATPSASSQPSTQDSELEPTAADGAQIVGMLGTVDAGEEGGLVNLRTGQGTDSPVMLGVDSGQRVLVLARNQAATWLYIRTADGVTGWMSADYVVTGQPVESYPVQ